MAQTDVIAPVTVGGEQQVVAFDPAGKSYRTFGPQGLVDCGPASADASVGCPCNALSSSSRDQVPNGLQCGDSSAPAATLSSSLPHCANDDAGVVIACEANGEVYVEQERVAELAAAKVLSLKERTLIYSGRTLWSAGPTGSTVSTFAARITDVIPGCSQQTNCDPEVAIVKLSQTAEYASRFAVVSVRETRRRWDAPMTRGFLLDWDARGPTAIFTVGPNAISEAEKVVVYMVDFNTTALPDAGTDGPAAGSLESNAPVQIGALNEGSGFMDFGKQDGLVHYLQLGDDSQLLVTVIEDFAIAHRLKTTD